MPRRHGPMSAHYRPSAARTARRAWLPWRRCDAQDTVAAVPTTEHTRPGVAAPGHLDWVSTGLRSIYGLLHQPLIGAQAPTPSEVDAVRQAMLEALRTSTSSPQRQDLAQRITFATELRSLWYLRSELMAMVACTHGEEHARLCVAALTLRFRGLLPEAGGYRRS